MAQSQSSTDVHQDELYPPNKRYALIDTNKKVDLENPLCPDESRILADILKNHPLRFSIDASSSLPWIYLGRFWHTLHEDGSKYTLKFMLDRKELTLTLNDFETIFHLPQATDNNHDHFVPVPTFSEMVPFYINELSFTLELRSTSNFKTTGLLQPWQTLCKMFSLCLTKRVTGYDQPAIQIIQMLYCFVNNIHVDYAKLLWKGFHYSLKNTTTLIPYPRFTKLIVSHYMTAYPDISRRVCNIYHNLADDVMIKSIFNSGKSKDVQMTQSQPIESTQGTHRTTSAPRSPNPVVPEGESIWQSRKVMKSLKLHKRWRSSPLRNDDNQIEPDTRLEPRSDKESLEVENIADISQPVNVIEEEEESSEDDYELRRREKGKHVEEIRNTPSPTIIRSPRIPTNPVSLDTDKLQELTETDTLPSSSTPSLSSPKSKLSATNRLLSLFKAKPGYFRHDPQLQKDDVSIWLALKIKFERIQVATTPCKLSAVRPRDQDDPHDDAHLEGENSPSTSAKLCKVVDEMLRQQCTSGDEHKYHIDQMQNFLKSDIVWESRKEIIVPLYQPKPTLVVQSCQRDPKAPGLPLVNQDFLYLKKGNSRLDKIVLSLHKFPAVIFPDDDIEERTSKWVKKCVKRFNPYARYGVEHWKNPHAKIFYIKIQQAPRKPKEEIYSNSKIVQIIKTYWELDHEHKFITKIVARRANGSIVSITESDYKNINKNDIEDIYLPIINHKVDDYAETGLLWSLSVFIRSIMIWERVHDFQLVLEGLKSYNNDVKYGYVTHNLSKEDVEYLQLFAEEIKERLKFRDQMRR
ncbi:hypothetical protein Tco_1319692 [Tanacetum coccineum]